MDQSLTLLKETGTASLLLDWYDRHHRTLPWRVSPGDRARGIRPDPYRVWLSEVMLQQTTVATVGRYFTEFTRRWPGIGDLAAASNDEVMGAWAGLGYYSRARNLHACAKAVAARGAFPETEAELRELPGIGPYTAAAISAIAFDRPAAVMDGNVERVMARLFAETAPLPGVKPVLKTHAERLTPAQRPGDYAQAVMDLGATVCTPRRPACGICPLIELCAARIEGIAADLPKKAPKAEKPLRHGWAFAAMKAGEVLVLRRPPKGLLGGMIALPSPEWESTQAEPAAPFAADWREIGEIRHIFTHFRLKLRVQVTTAIPDPLPPGTSRLPIEEAIAKMPTVFAKALKLASR